MYDYECYQKEQLTKSLLLLENHLTSFKCEWCIKKHQLEVKAFAEETYRITPVESEKALFKRIFENALTDVTTVREFRSKVMEITPKECISMKDAREAIRSFKIPMKTHSAQELMEMSGIMR